MQAAKREAQPHVPAIVKEAKHAPDVHGEAHLVGAMLLVLVLVLVVVVVVVVVVVFVSVSGQVSVRVRVGARVRLGLAAKSTAASAVSTSSGVRRERSPARGGVLSFGDKPASVS